MSDTGDWLGQVVESRYELTAKIGTGGMAHIYKATDAKLGRQVVIKVPRPAMLEEADFAGRFTREIRSLVRLRHPFIVPILDVGEHQGVPFMVLDYLSGGSLRDRLEAQGPQTPEQLRGWLEGVASALDFCHQSECLHRDVKPDNILFDAQGHPALSDFGIAKVVSVLPQKVQPTVLTGAGQAAGTPHYMAPELIMGQTIDGRIDQYALAVTVFESLSGKMPIRGQTGEAILVAQVTAAPEPLDSRFGALADVLAQALAKEPHKRYGSCMAFARAVLSAGELADTGGEMVAAEAVVAADVPVEAAVPPARSRGRRTEKSSAVEEETTSHRERRSTKVGPSPRPRAAAETPAVTRNKTLPQPRKSAQAGMSSEVSSEEPARAASKPWLAIGIAALVLPIAAALLYIAFFRGKSDSPAGNGPGYEGIRWKTNK